MNKRKSRDESEVNRPSKKRVNDGKELDPFTYQSENKRIRHDLIIQHFPWVVLKHLMLVSRQWYQVINTSESLMEKISFKLTSESRNELINSTRKYESIEVNHDDLFIQNDDFLEPILRHLDSLESLTFQGAYENSCIEDFFNKLNRERFNVKNLTFIGDVTNAELLLERFYDVKIYESVKFIGLSSERFCDILRKFQKTKSFFLEDMDIKNLDRTYFCKQRYIQKIDLSRTKVSRKTLKDFMNYHSDLREIMTNSLSSLDDEVKELFKEEDGKFVMTMKQIPSNDFLMNLLEKKLQLIQKIDLSRTKVSRKTLKDFMNYHSDLREIMTNSLSSLGDEVKELFKEEDGKFVMTMKQIPSNDFLMNLLEKELQLIFQHFNCEDLMNVSRVSKTWNKFSNKAIEKKLLFNSHQGHERTRIYYENIELMINDDVSFQRLASFGSLKELTLEVASIDTVSVKRLFSEQLRCHELRVLSITCHIKLPLDDMELPSTIELLHLNIFELQANDLTTTSFYKSLVQAKHLIDLQFDDVTGLEKMFVTDLSAAFSAKLKRLHLPILFPEQNDETVKNVTKFFLTQFESLIELSVKDIHTKTLLEILMMRNKLESFEFAQVKGSLDQLRNCTRKMESVKELKLSEFSRNLTELEPVLMLFPELRKIRVKFLTNQSCDFFLTNFKELKEVYYIKKIPANIPSMNQSRVKFYHW